MSLVSGATAETVVDVRHSRAGISAQAMNMSSNRRLAISFESVSPKKTAWSLKLRFMAKKKRTVITEESHEVWIIRNPNDEAHGDVGESANASPTAVIPRDQIVSGSSEAVGQVEEAATYRLDISDLQDASILSAIVVGPTIHYQAPSWIKDKIGNSVVRWHVTAFDQERKLIAETGWRYLRVAHQYRVGL